MSKPTAGGPAYLLRGVAPLGGEPTDLLLADGVIAAVGPGAAAQAPAGTVTIDGAGLVALPGLVDLHTHLREPGREDAETVWSGTRAAALGGYTSVHAMANTSPVADTAGVVEQVWRLGNDAGWVDVHPVGAVSVGLGGTQLAELGAMAHSAAQVRVFSDDGKCVHDPVLMRRALEYVKAFDGVIAQHSQEPLLTAGAQMHEGVVSAEVGLAGWPAVAEEAIIARDVLLAEHVGSRLHVQHLSTAGSVEIIRWAKARGIDVTAEATPHHLLLTDELARTYDPVYKVNPPLRTAEDVEALRAGLADGTIDIVGTDHAPHTREDKDCEWAAAAFGMTGLETALSIVATTMVATGRMSWADVARVMSSTPARIGRTDAGPRAQGRPLEVGEPANVTLVDPATRWVVDPAAQATASRNSPYGGRELTGRVVATFLRGRATVLDGTTVPSRDAVPAGPAR
ncbi:dihydroorotase [Actinotalea sp.]|uniref:dihydroorotase n=1 Tax=Actinotalea sp. TaxID=1872145 RepID=UPI002CF4062A|nr:dihydroorotase [Actinotalea sp.]HQY32680.1 dihydroorotase [Actinotalea sp.]HRA51593.1 dihydroorotase [Actinotalea sp.]